MKSRVFCDLLATGSQVKNRERPREKHIPKAKESNIMRHLRLILQLDQLTSYRAVILKFHFTSFPCSRRRIRGFTSTLSFTKGKIKYVILMKTFMYLFRCVERMCKVLKKVDYTLNVKECLRNSWDALRLISLIEFTFFINPETKTISWRKGFKPMLNIIMRH